MLRVFYIDEPVPSNFSRWCTGSQDGCSEDIESIDVFKRRVCNSHIWYTWHQWSYNYHYKGEDGRSYINEYSYASVTQQAHADFMTADD